nr:MAG TPA: hypothetical protein [Caudoviricetes sp.]
MYSAIVSTILSFAVGAEILRRNLHISNMTNQEAVGINRCIYKIFAALATHYLYSINGRSVFKILKSILPSSLVCVIKIIRPVIPVLFWQDWRTHGGFCVNQPHRCHLRPSLHRSWDNSYTNDQQTGQVSTNYKSSTLIDHKC